MATTMSHDSRVRTGGVALIAAAVGFMGVFAYLAVRFNYPDVLDAPAATALPALLLAVVAAMSMMLGLLLMTTAFPAMNAQTASRSRSSARVAHDRHRPRS